MFHSSAGLPTVPTVEFEKSENLKKFPEEKRKPYNPSNPWNRKRKPEGGVAAALFTEENGEISCSQFQTNFLLESPELFRPLIFTPSQSTSPIKTRFGAVPWEASSPEKGTTYNSRRSYEVEYSTEEGGKKTKAQLLIFSPKKNKAGEIRAERFVENKVNLNSGFSKESRKAAFDALDNEMPAFKKAKNVVQGQGETYQISRKKELNRRKLIKNNTVWKKSAKQAMLDFIEKNKDKYDSEQLAVLKKLVTLFKMEWLHRLGVGLSVKTFNPQVKKNMGSGFKVINTWMMVLENVASHFSFNNLGNVVVKPEFEMLGDSDIIQKVLYSVTITNANRKVEVSGAISALAVPSRSNFPATTDKRLLKEVVAALLTGMKPTRRDSFLQEKKIPLKSSFFYSCIFKNVVDEMAGMVSKLKQKVW
jgi:hypothetical protein